MKTFLHTFFSKCIFRNTPNAKPGTLSLIAPITILRCVGIYFFSASLETRGSGVTCVSRHRSGQGPLCMAPRGIKVLKVLGSPKHLSRIQ